MRRSEILAPAGSAEALAAALAAGADAVYFGLDDGWNARARADNFRLDELPATMRQIHRAGARGYLTLNTLVFEAELAPVERLIRAAAAAGVDALIVQDPAVALIARAVCPALELHASTQMTLSSPEAAAVAARLGITRIVVPRELSVDEIRAFAQASPIELEVFVHGALCVSWSGQCLTSESWGGRSANRGQCAQSCRLPYDLVVDGERRDLGDVTYLLSPQDLAGAPAVADLMAAGVASLKIEGRQKSAAYVATTVDGYRRWRDAVLADAADPAALGEDLAAMTLAYSRGASLGFLGGVDHQRLVVGRAPKHRGAYLGRVVAIGARTVEVVRDDDGRAWTGGLALPARPAAAVAAPDRVPAPRPTPVAPRPGQGVVFDDGHPEAAEAGGPIFSVTELADDRWLLGFGSPGPDLRAIAVGTRLWVTSDPAHHRAVEQLTRAASTVACQSRCRWRARPNVRWW
ncbi:MAG: U32 family peptidase [Kofleriaceae bacterium]